MRAGVEVGAVAVGVTELGTEEKGTNVYPLLATILQFQNQLDHIPPDLPQWTWPTAQHLPDFQMVTRMGQVPLELEEETRIRA